MIFLSMEQTATLKHWFAPERPGPLVGPHVIHTGHVIRRLGPADTQLLEGLGPESFWISKTWGGPGGLASSGFGWGAFVEGQLASVACTFFLGAHYEDIGVATEPQYRGLGLSTACARALCGDIRAREHQPSWTTSPDNIGSVRVAEKLGFVFDRHDSLVVIGIEIPVPASNA